MQKFDVVVILSRFSSMIGTQFKSEIKKFRTDNAKELAFNALFSKKGILQQCSCIDTPQQNSVVKRKHQYLLNVARGLLFF